MQNSSNTPNALCCSDKGKENKQANQQKNPTNHKLTEKHKQPLGYELSTQSQKKPVIYKCKLNPVWVKKPGKKGMVSWSLGCSCLPHQYNLISLGQISPSSNTLSQQFTLFPCFHLPAPGPLHKPSCTETSHIFQEHKRCWKEISLPPLQLQQCVPASLAHTYLPRHSSPRWAFAPQKNH